MNPAAIVGNEIVEIVEIVESWEGTQKTPRLGPKTAEAPKFFETNSLAYGTTT